MVTSSIVTFFQFRLEDRYQLGAISRKRVKIEVKLLLIVNRK